MDNDSMIDENEVEVGFDEDTFSGDDDILEEFGDLTEESE